MLSMLSAMIIGESCDRLHIIGGLCDSYRRELSKTALRLSRWKPCTYNNRNADSDNSPKQDGGEEGFLREYNRLSCL